MNASVRRRGVGLHLAAIAATSATLILGIGHANAQVATGDTSQAKIALLQRDDGGWEIPAGRVPTTHILKPPSGDFTHIVMPMHISR